MDTMMSQPHQSMAGTGGLPVPNQEALLHGAHSGHPPTAGQHPYLASSPQMAAQSHHHSNHHTPSTPAGAVLGHPHQHSTAVAASNARSPYTNMNSQQLNHSSSSLPSMHSTSSPQSLSLLSPTTHSCSNSSPMTTGTTTIPITHAGNHVHRGNTVYGKFQMAQQGGFGAGQEDRCDSRGVMDTTGTNGRSPWSVDLFIYGVDFPFVNNSSLCHRSNDSILLSLIVCCYNECHSVINFMLLQ